MSECQALPRKDERSEKPDLIVSPSFQTDHKKTSKLPDEYTLLFHVVVSPLLAHKWNL